MSTIRYAKEEYSRALAAISVLYLVFAMMELVLGINAHSVILVGDAAGFVLGAAVAGILMLDLSGEEQMAKRMKIPYLLLVLLMAAPVGLVLMDVLRLQTPPQPGLIGGIGFFSLIIHMFAAFFQANYGKRSVQLRPDEMADFLRAAIGPICVLVGGIILNFARIPIVDIVIGVLVYAVSVGSRWNGAAAAFRDGAKLPEEPRAVVQMQGVPISRAEKFLKQDDEAETVTDLDRV